MGAPRNPFSTEHLRPGALEFVFDEADARTLLEQWARARQAQLVGPPGSGKTTLLRSLGRAARSQGVRTLELRADRDALPRLGPDAPFDALLLDEADALSRWRLHRLRRAIERAGRTLLVATHRDLGLPTLRRCAVDEALAIRLTEQVLLASPDLPVLVRADEIVAPLRLHDHNLREALLALYDLYEARWAERY
ncbi:MAG: ATP-binding protein [Polyangiaceae bacterium]